MQFGFEVELTREGLAEFRILAPERQAADAPVVTFARDALTGSAVALVGQLCYRDELPGCAHATGPDGAPSDAEVVLRVFRAYGARGLARLEGDFALALFDPTGRRLIAQRDPLGAWPLYFGCRDGCARVGTSLLSLAAQDPGAGVDPGFLGRFLMFTFASVELCEEATAFRGLRRVLAGTQLALRPDREPERLWRYGWRWMDGAPEAARGATLEEAAGRYASLLRRAVEERVRRGRPAAHLSGGMDSSSVVCFARDALAGRGGRLPTLSLVYAMQSLACERDFIDLVIRQGGAIEPHLMEGDDLLAFRWFDREIPPHDEPYAGLFYLAAERRLVDAALAVGASGVLTGTGAELTAEGNRLHMADLLRRGHARAALREARRWSRVRNQSAWSMLAQTAITPNVPPALRDGLGAFARGGHGRWPDLGPYSVPPWIPRSFVRAHDLTGAGLEWARRLHGFPAERSTYRAALEAAAGACSGWYLAGPRGVHTARPFLDPRLIEFALALPRGLREVPGVPKPLLSAGMRGVLPEPIRTRVHKRSFNDVFWKGLAGALAPLEDLVRRSRAGEELGLLDKDILIDAMRQHAHGIGQPLAGHRISMMLALIAWLDRLPAWRRPLSAAGGATTTLHACRQGAAAGLGAAA